MYSLYEIALSSLFEITENVNLYLPKLSILPLICTFATYSKSALFERKCIYSSLHENSSYFINVKWTNYDIKLQYLILKCSFLFWDEWQYDAFLF